MDNSLISLESLFELQRNLVSAESGESIYHNVVLSLLGKLRISKAVILEKREERCRVLFSRGRIKLPESEFQLHDSVPERSWSLTEYLESKGLGLVREILSDDETSTHIALGFPIGQTTLTDPQERYLSLVLSIAESALGVVKSKRALQASAHAVEQRNYLLTAFVEMSRDFSVNLSVDEILRLLSYRVMGQLLAPKFSLVLLDKDYVPFFAVNSLKLEPSRASELIGVDLKISEAFFDDTSIIHVTPMSVRGEIKGALVLGKRLGGSALSERDKNFAEALGNSAITALENARLFHEELEKKKMESELDVARDIQSRLFPASLPTIDGYTMAAVNVSSKVVGGDYYDVIPLDESRTFLCIADVSGKGIPASLLMANVQASLRSLVPLQLPLRELIERVNVVVCSNTTPDKFVTFFGGILDTSLHTFTYINAGHNPPYAVDSDGSLHELTEGGLILGIFDTPPPYEIGEFTLEEGTSITLYTDGVTEAMNLELEEYSDDRLKEIVIGVQSQTAESILEAIVADVQAHVAGADRSDDFTCLVFRRGS